MERGPFRRRIPWKAEWDQHTELYRGELDVAASKHGWLVLLAIWRPSSAPSCCCRLF